MTTSVTPSTKAAKGTSEQWVAGLFGLKGDNWMRHANPVSVWTRFSGRRPHTPRS
jgi:hypothetical protein